MLLVPSCVGSPCLRAVPWVVARVDCEMEATVTTTLIEDHRAQIADMCRSFGVRRLDVFGSAVRDDFDPERSDVDFLVEFEPDEERNRFRDYFALRDALTRLLGRPVDLVMARAVTNRYLHAAIEAERRLVYAA